MLELVQQKQIFEISFLKFKRRPYICSPEREGGAVAQSVEQRTENPCVAGSIPAHTTKEAVSKGQPFLISLHSSVLFNVKSSLEERCCFRRLKHNN